MPRFELGARVLVRSTIFNGHVGDEGSISKVIPHKSGKRTLDKYEVEFADGEKSLFWDIQLGRPAKVAPVSATQNIATTIT